VSKPKHRPTSLIQAIRYFSDLDVCIQFVANCRWSGNPICPQCAGTEHSYLTTRRLWKCKACKKQFSVKVGTIFEDSALGLDKWLPAVWLIANSKNGISSHELARALDTTQKSAWFMLHRIRLGMQAKTFEKMTGHVEVDETYIGGKARFQHESKKKHIGTGGMGKAAVMGLLERHGPDGHSIVRTKVVPNVRRYALAPEVHKHVEPGAEVFTDSLKSYADLKADYVHKVIDHAERYVDGEVHTNGLENFWSLLKRGLHGTYVSVEPFHLFRYLDERVFTYNLRELDDYGRFQTVLRAIAGRRLTYAELTAQP